MRLFSRKWARGALGVALVALLAACGSRPAGLLRPNGVAVAPDGSLYVMDHGNYRVVHLSATGDLLASFGRLGRDPDDIYSGWDVALDSAGNIYICNIVNDEDDINIHDGVKMFSPDGQFLREVGGQDYGDEDDARTPYGLDVDRQDRVYVADYYVNTVRVFDAQGEPIAEFFGEMGSQDGQFNGIQDVAVDDQRSLMYVTDYVNNRVQQFVLAVTDSGELTVTHSLTFGTYGREPGQFAYLEYLTVDDASGRVYVGDMANRRIQVFDAQGKFIAQFSAPVKVWQVIGLGLGSDGAVYAADAFNNAIWVFEPDGRLRSRIEVKP